MEKKKIFIVYHNHSWSFSSAMKDKHSKFKTKEEADIQIQTHLSYRILTMSLDIVNEARLDALFIIFMCSTYLRLLYRDVWAKKFY